MDKFTKSFVTEWRKLDLPFSGETFVVAVSGGADSLSLALVLNELRQRKKLNLRFVIAHFNHNLREAESQEDEDFVNDFASEYEFELALGSGEISEKGNLEQNARRARYEFLSEIANNVNAYGVLTAHTINDQAETFLLNLLRGSGIGGLGAMKAISNLNWKLTNEKSKIQLIRPFLHWATRGETEQFCKDKGINFRYDAMNENFAFRRVRLRKVLIPMLEDFNPKIIKILAETANILREDAQELKIDESEIEEELTLKDFKKLSKSKRYRTLRSWLKKHLGNLRRLELKHIRAIDDLAASGKSGRKIELPGNNIVIKKSGKLRFESEKVEKK